MNKKENNLGLKPTISRSYSTVEGTQWGASDYATVVDSGTGFLNTLGNIFGWGHSGGQSQPSQPSQPSGSTPIIIQQPSQPVKQGLGAGAWIGITLGGLALIGTTIFLVTRK